MILRTLLCVLLAASFASTHSYAAVITWGAVQDTTTSAANDVADGGDVILALNGQSQSNSSPLRPGSVTLDGIVFFIARLR